MCVFQQLINSHYPKDQGKTLNGDMASARLLFIEAQSVCTDPNKVITKKAEV